MNGRRRELHLLEVDLSWPPEGYLQRKLQGLGAHGVRTTVAAEIADGVRAEHLRGVDLIRLPRSDEHAAICVLGAVRDGAMLARRSPRRLWRLVRAVQRAAGRGGGLRTVRLLRRHLPLMLADADVMHFEWEPAALGFLPLFEASGSPVVLSSHGGVHIRPRTGDQRMIDAYPVVFSRAAVVHCVSVAVREEAVRFGLDRARARVIRPAVDPGYFCPVGDGGGRRGALRVVAVGELNWIKGYDDALEAIALLAGDGVPVSYEILGGVPAADSGKPDDRGRLQYLVHELALEQRVRFLGAVPEAVVRERLRASDVLLQASLSEGLPNTVLEAMACTVPVVVTDCGGLREAVDDGVEGLVCPRRSPHALADALRSLWRDPARARQMGHAGRARVLAEFTLETQLNSFKQLYEEVTAQRMRGT